MKIKSALATEMSGSLGGLVASHNRGGLYLRARAIPTNPNSQFQQVIRAIVAQLAALWNETLTGLQRRNWDSYAAGVPLPDRLGEPRNVGGLAMYIRSNTPRLQASMPRVDDGPLILTLPALQPLSMDVATETLQNFTLDYVEEPGVPETWLSEDGAALLTYSSRLQNVTINYFKGPYRFANALLGDSVTPLTPPFLSDSAFDIVAGRLLFARAQLTRADGRLSVPQLFFQLVENGPAATATRQTPQDPKHDLVPDDRNPKRKKRQRREVLVP